MIIQSLLDTDLYKYSVMQFAFHRYFNDKVKYKFVCRTAGIDFTSIVPELKKELESLSHLTLSSEEIAYLKTVKGGVFKDDFLQFLKTFKLNFKDLHFITDSENLEIEITGTWTEATLWETFVLCIVNELYFKNKYPNLSLKQGKENLTNSINEVKNDNLNYPNNLVKIVEFGTRRRFSQKWQEEVYNNLRSEISGNVIGTSNLLLAMKTNTPVIGTHPHECVSFSQAKHGYFDCQKTFLKEWWSEYGSELSVALTDIYKTDIFLKDFDKELSENYQGLRQDSGEPLEWLEKVINHYKKMNIDPKTKKIVFSDSLTVKKAIDIKNEVNMSVQDSYGIGTSLTNNVGVPAINIVIKMIEACGLPVIKISDEPKKAVGDKDVIEKVRKHYEI